ncbi:MAG TPA: FAD-binding oxidoreductase [Leptolyngbyaceae cyanobacterium M33_DOE_097]|uniref:FAD-binding oxidoreductase n=1 Tax=Oscillatoriales cyanobacterium SpSt-418 TaxID=2282169 RepID=A0A7C3KGL4_9CYAN|nr:FAD-binding oxidoreductase [Leptolyngbyaceae cyanobacterium M33_DOE_097]
MHQSLSISPINWQELEAIAGAESVKTLEQADPKWSQAIARAMGAGLQPPQAIVFPDSAEKLAEVMTCAYKQGWRVLPCGAGSKLTWGGLIQAADLLVSTARLNRLIDHAIGDLTITAEAGVRFADLQHQLAQANQFLALDPAFAEQATLGGIVATADTGSLRQRYGGVRDMLLGISFVRADGLIAKAGGRVVKNVAGYDLMKLFTGSYGTLGIVTQMTFRVYPQSEASESVLVQGEVAALEQVRSTVLRSGLTPIAMDWLSPPLASQLTDAATTVPALLLKFQAIAPSVTLQVQRVKELAQSLQLAAIGLTGDLETQLWQQLQTHLAAANQPDQTICKVGVLPASATLWFQQLERLAPKGFGQIHAASGLGRLVFTEPVEANLLLTLRRFCQEHNGFLTVLQATPAIKQQLDPWGDVGTALSVMQLVKRQFDPNGVLSPGRFVGGI